MVAGAEDRSSERRARCPCRRHRRRRLHRPRADGAACRRRRPVVAVTRRAIAVPPGVTLHAIGEITATTDWSALLQGARAVVHLAAPAHAPSGADQQWIRGEAAAAAQLARAAGAAGCRAAGAGELDQGAGRCQQRCAVPRRAAGIARRCLWLRQMAHRGGDAHDLRRGRAGADGDPAAAGLRPRRQSQFPARCCASSIAGCRCPWPASSTAAAWSISTTSSISSS